MCEVRTHRFSRMIRVYVYKVMIYYVPSDSDDAASAGPSAGAITAVIMSIVFFCCILPGAVGFIIVRVPII